MKIRVAAVLALVAGCSSSDPTTPVTQAAADGGLTDAGSGTPSCALAAVNGATAVNAEFVTVSATTAPPTLNGGTLAGRFKVTSARVYFPAETAAFVDTSKSSGTVLAWAVFQGNDYRLHLDLDLSVSALGGTQPQKGNSDSQGTFTINSGNSFVLAPTCDPQDSGASAATYSYGVTGTDLTILIKTKVPGFNADSYTELHAVPE